MQQNQNSDKGPLLDTSKDARGSNIDPSPQQPLIKCYRCQGIGHKSNNCPKQRELRYCDLCSEETPPMVREDVIESEEDKVQMKVIIYHVWSTNYA